MARYTASVRAAAVSLVFGLVAAVGCADDEQSSPRFDAAVSIDAAPAPDAAMIDAAVPDADPPDADPPDADPPDADPPDADPPDADPGVVVVLPAAQDATICTDGNAIGDGSLFIGVSNDDVGRRALIEFDLATIPAGATILEAQVTMVVDLSMGSVEANAHRVTTDWQEGPAVGAGPGGGQCGTPGATDVTETATGLGVDWTTVGGDFATPASATAAAVGTFAIAGLGADVQAWLDGTRPNHGWILVATDEATAGNAVRVVSPPSLELRYRAP